MSQRCQKLFFSPMELACFLTNFLPFCFFSKFEIFSKIFFQGFKGFLMFAFFKGALKNDACQCWVGCQGLHGSGSSSGASTSSCSAPRSSATVLRDKEAGHRLVLYPPPKVRVLFFGSAAENLLLGSGLIFGDFSCLKFSKLTQIPNSIIFAFQKHKIFSFGASNHILYWYELRCHGIHQPQRSQIQIFYHFA